MAAFIRKPRSQLRHERGLLRSNHIKFLYKLIHWHTIEGLGTSLGWGLCSMRHRRRGITSSLDMQYRGPRHLTGKGPHELNQQNPLLASSASSGAMLVAVCMGGSTLHLAHCEEVVGANTSLLSISGLLQPEVHPLGYMPIGGIERPNVYAFDMGIRLSLISSASSYYTDPGWVGCASPLAYNPMRIRRRKFQGPNASSSKKTFPPTPQRIPIFSVIALQSPARWNNDTHPFRPTVDKRAEKS
ncbi:hypothetical protein Tco_1522294 [Tanacetum coccineum]